MRSASSPTNAGSAYVIDTSVAINLIASGFPAQIIEALPAPVLAVDVIPLELEEGRRHGRPEPEIFNNLVLAGLIEIVSLGGRSASIFERLVTGLAAETLDDGEAATIAYATTHGGTAVIDERKASRICRERFSALAIERTIDLFAHPNVRRSLGKSGLCQAVLNALQLARMRVLPDHVKWVVDLVGEDQAARCVSLPRRFRPGPNELG